MEEPLGLISSRMDADMLCGRGLLSSGRISANSQIFVYSLVDRHLVEHGLQMVGQVQIVAEVEVCHVDRIEDTQILGLTGSLFADLVQDAGFLIQYHLESRFSDLIDRSPKQFSDHILGSDQVHVWSVQECRKSDDAIRLADMVLRKNHEWVDVSVLAWMR